MLSFLKAPANAPLITDKHEVDARYRYWRRHILITIWLGYALFYFTRKSFNAAAPEILASGILTRSDIWLLSLCYVLVYVVRAAINDWGNLYMSETLGVDLVTANTAVSMFELGGFIGALVAGWGSDKLFNGNRGPMNLIFAAGILLSVGSLWLMPFASYVMQAACFFTTGFFVFGPQMLIGMAAAECSHKEAAGAATGFVGLFAYLGASLSGWPLAKVLEIWHWTGFFAVIAIAAGISALLLLPFLNAQAPRETSEA
ncbi:MFS transporter [Salmonella enterica]|nr:MFS transporter [Salmonella enterica]